MATTEELLKRVRANRLNTLEKIVFEQNKAINALHEEVKFLREKLRKHEEEEHFSIPKDETYEIEKMFKDLEKF